MSIDLHLHTHHSDGSWSPTQLVTEAKRLKFRSIAITDHDTTAGITEAIECAGSDIEVIPGIEINTVLPGTDCADVDIHILGYFIDPNHESLRTVIRLQQEARLRLVDDIVEKLNSLGIPLTLEMIKDCAGEGSIGRPHITKAIVQAGGAPSITAAYERFMVRRSQDYVKRHSVTPYTAIEAINEAGGLASIAHPGKSPRIKEIIIDLKTKGLRAVEAYHRSHSLTTLRHHMKFASANGMLVTGGSDCHGPSEEYPASIGSVRVPQDVLHNLKEAMAAAS